MSLRPNIVRMTPGRTPTARSASIRNDGFANVLSGLGVPGLDRSASTAFTGFNSRHGLARFWASRFALWDATEIYMARGIAAKIIDRPADDSISHGVEIEGDDDEVMANEFDRLSVLTKMADAVRWARLYGGSVIIPLAKDGGDLNTPLNLTNLDQIIELRVIDITQVRVTDRIYTDPADTKYGKPEFFEIHPPGGTMYEIHETRMIMVGSDPLPAQFRGQDQIWWAGRSALEGCISDLGRYEQALEWGSRLLERKQQGIYSMEGLGEMFANGDDEIVTRRINMVDLVRSNLNSVVIDKLDTYTIENLDLSGVQTLIQENQVALAASSNIPVMILFGKSATGLHATGQGDLESYYGMVGQIQQRTVKPALEHLISILWVQKQLEGPIVDQWSVEFNPLWVPDDKEQALTEKTEAEAEQTEVNTLINLMNNGILTPVEIRTIIVDKYADYGFEDSPQTSGDDVDYAEEIEAGSGQDDNENGP
jgi:uncharacterized protein